MKRILWVVKIKIFLFVLTFSVNAAAKVPEMQVGNVISGVKVSEISSGMRQLPGTLKPPFPLFGNVRHILIARHPA